MALAFTHRRLCHSTGGGLVSVGRHVRSMAALGIGVHPQLCLAPARLCAGDEPLCATRLVFGRPTNGASGMPGAGVGCGALLAYVPASAAMDVGSMRDADRYGVMPTDEDVAAILARLLTDAEEDPSSYSETVLLSFMVADMMQRGTGLGRWAQLATVYNTRHGRPTAGTLEGGDWLSEARSASAELDELVGAVRKAFRDGLPEDGEGIISRPTPVPPLDALLRARRYVTSSLAFLCKGGDQKEGSADEMPSVLPLLDLLSNAVVLRGGGASGTSMVATSGADLGGNVSMALCSGPNLRRLLSMSAPLSAEGDGDASRLDALELLLQHEGDAAPEVVNMVPQSPRAVKGLRRPKAKSSGGCSEVADVSTGAAAVIPALVKSGGRRNLLFPTVGGRTMLRHASAKDQYYVFFTTAEVQQGTTLFLSSDVSLADGDDPILGPGALPSPMSVFRSGIV